MSVKVRRANKIYWQVYKLEELFFYALYKFRAFWVAALVFDGTAKRIKTAFNINIRRYSIELNTDYLIHFLNSHFAETRKNQRGIHFSDVNKIAEVVNNFDFVERGNTEDTFLFKKQFPDGLFELVVFIDHSKKRISGKSFRIKT